MIHFKTEQKLLKAQEAFWDAARSFHQPGDPQVKRQKMDQAYERYGKVIMECQEVKNDPKPT